MPITTNAKKGVCFAFPNVCPTSTPAGLVPIPYPSIGKLDDATGLAETVLAGGAKVVTSASKIPSTSGDEAAAQDKGGPVSFVGCSKTVFAAGAGVVRLLDATKQNGEKARGFVLAGLPTVLVGD
jgi:hypothetical protein